MRYSGRSSFSGQRGFTLLELSVALAISSVLMVAMVAIVAAMIRVPIKVSSELKASQQVQKATLLITEDASMAQSFTAGAEPDYGTFQWYEFTGTSPVSVSARYYWANQEVLRVLTRGGEASSPQVVMAGILQYSDVVFQYTAPAWTYNDSTKLWSYSEGKVTVSLTTTHEAGAEYPDTVFTASLLSNTRPETDRPVPLPGSPLPVPPPANQVDFRIAGDPTIIQGTYLSGSGTDLRFDDTAYYSVRATSTPRTLIWEATSEAVDYTSITNIKVEFTGRVTGSGVTQEFYIYNPSDPAHTDGGYATSPDQADVYPSANVDKTVSFEFTDTDIAYVNSLPTKVIKIKLRATRSSSFDLRADKLVFKVAGTPSPTFYRDYVLDTDPTLEVGSYVSGDYTSMATDDTSYYRTRRVGTTIQWTAVSEPVGLDTVSSIEVRFIGRSTQSGVVQGIYVFNPANGGDGYPATPDLQTTYSTANSDQLASFFLSAADVDYVESLFPKEVRIRIKGTGTTTSWDLLDDQLLFRVTP